MNIDKLKKQFNDENSCRYFFESVIWVDGRKCPHSQCDKYYLLKGASVRCGTYECARCKRQFTVTTKTPMHSTKLSFWKWLQAIYYIVNSSKGISSVILAQWVGVSQPMPETKISTCLVSTLETASRQICLGEFCQTFQAVIDFIECCL